MDSSAWPLWGLFVSAFLSSTLLPGGSEAVLAWLHGGGDYDVSLLVLIATIGNTLGGMTSWVGGRLIAWRWPAKKFTLNHVRAVERLRHYGSPALLFSWLPVVGDPLCVAAGWLRVHWALALLLIAAGKLVRYAVIVWVV